jgi:glycosyltransferase involved in cell wall biosynthesis
MKISYAIPVCNESKEIKYLLDYLFKHKRQDDEIVVQCDKGNTTQEVYEVLKQYPLNLIEFSLNKDFASFKNNLKDHCSGDYIFQIDADEYPDEYLMNTLPSIIKDNPGVDIFWVPRINTIEGLTLNHVQKWKWVLDNQERINFPDYQCRVLKNVKRIKWSRKVHEILIGFKVESKFPVNDEFCLHHPKTIERQEKQNEFYNTI